MASMGGFLGEVPGGRPRGRATAWTAHLWIAEVAADARAAVEEDRSGGDVLEGVLERLENIVADLSGEHRPFRMTAGYLPERAAVEHDREMREEWAAMVNAEREDDGQPF